MNYIVLDSEETGIVEYTERDLLPSEAFPSAEGYILVCTCRIHVIILSAMSSFVTSCILVFTLNFNLPLFVEYDFFSPELKYIAT